MLQKGFQALLDFREFTKRRFGNPARTWFMLDPDANMRLGEKQFARACTEIGFRGNLTALWRYVDSDQTGTVSLLELDPATAMVFADFKLLLRERFRDSTAEAFRFLDVSRTGRVSRADFAVRLRQLGYQGAVSRLFELLDRQGLGALTVSELAFLDRWRPPQYLYCKPDFDGLQRIKEQLVELHHSPLRAWRRVLDRAGSMRVSWDGFRAVCQELLRSVPPGQAMGLPSTEAEVAAVWRALDTDCSGWISLREFDQEAHEAVAEFKRWADRVHGGVVRAFHSLDGSNLRLSEGELRKAARGPDSCKADLQLLFEGLDVGGNWALTEADVRFLDHWDLAWEDWEAAVKGLTSSYGRR